MTVEELAKLGARMREAQRDYFRSAHDSRLLATSKSLERMFDEACYEVIHGPRPKQANLFGGTEDGRAQ